MISQANFRFLALVLCLTVLTGCAASGGNSRSRGKLSDATAEAAGEEEENGRDQSRTRTKDDVYTSDNNEDYITDYYEEDTDIGGSFLAGVISALFSGGDDDSREEGNFQDAEEDSAGFHRDNLNLWYSRSELAGDAIRSFSTWTLMYSSFLKNSETPFRGQFGLYYGKGKKGGQPHIQEGVRWISEAGADLGFRNYFTPDHSLMGFYLLYGLRGGILFWSYANAIEAATEDGGTEMISGDQLLVFTPYMGIGTSLLQTKALHFGLSLTAGCRFSVGKTFKGFDNDVFKDVGEVRLNFEASIFF